MGEYLDVKKYIGYRFWPEDVFAVHLLADGI